MASLQKTYDSVLPDVPCSVPFIYKNKVWRLLNCAGGHNKKIMSTIIDIITFMHEHYAEVLTCQFILFPPCHSTNNQDVSKFFHDLLPYLTKEYVEKLKPIQLGRIGYIWVREQSNAKKQHYHCALFINEDKVRSSEGILKRVQELWQKKFNGSFSIPRNNYYVSKRLNVDLGVSQQEVICRLSYLAKNATKGLHSSNTKRYGFNRKWSSN